MQGSEGIVFTQKISWLDPPEAQIKLPRDLLYIWVLQDYKIF